MKKVIALRGMGRIFRRRSRVTGKESPTLWIGYRVDGKEKRESTHSTDPKVAKALLKKRLADVEERTYIDPARWRQKINALLDALVAYYDVHDLGSMASVQSQVKAWREPMGDCPAGNLTTNRGVRQVQAWKQDGVPASTSNRRVALLKRAYRLAHLFPDPARLDFSKLFLAEHSPRGRYLTADAFAAIQANLPEYLHDFVEFAYLCGTRKRQLALTTWAHWNADLRELTWAADEVKAKTPFVLPLDGPPLDNIHARSGARRLHCRYVFHGPHCAPGRRPSKDYGCLGDFKKAWATACKKAGFPVGRKNGGFVFHNTRHTAVTNLVNAGTPAHEAMAVSGHKTRSVFDRYSIQLKDQTRAALRRQTTYTEGLRKAEPKVVPIR